jgi:hypothetical protein
LRYLTKLAFTFFDGDIASQEIGSTAQKQDHGSRTMVDRMEFVSTAKQCHFYEVVYEPSQYSAGPSICMDGSGSADASANAIES